MTDSDWSPKLAVHHKNISRAFELKINYLFKVIILNITTDTNIKVFLNKVDVINLERIEVKYSWLYPDYGMKFGQAMTLDLEYIIDADHKLKEYLLNHIYSSITCTLLENTSFKLYL